MNLKDLLERIIRKNNLTLEESALLMDEIMSGRMTQAQIAAFLVALRMKGETIDEITGFAQTMRRMVRTLLTKRPNVVDTCGTGGDGMKTFNISTLAAFVVAGAGIPVAKHGNVAVSSQCGSADLLKALGVKVDADRWIMEKALEEIGICFLFAPLFHHAMKYAATPRREIGVRTVFNILGPLTNPAGARAQVLGVFRKDLVETMANVLSNLGSTHAFVVHGEDGLDEVTTTGETHIAHLTHGIVSCQSFKSEDIGIDRSSLDALKGGNAQYNVEIAHAVLKGKKGPQRDIVLLNAAFAICAGTGTANIKEGYDKAGESVDSGLAYKKLQALVDFTSS